MAKVLTIFLLSLAASQSYAARQFTLRLYADRCSGLPDRDRVERTILGIPTGTYYSEDNGYGNDALIAIWINNVFNVEYPYYKTNTNSPNWNWQTNLIQNVALNSLLQYRLRDYDRYIGHRRQDIGTLSFRLPNNPNSWSATTYGYRGHFGSTQQTNLNNGGWCRYKVQFYAERCEVGEYVDAKGYCVSCDTGFFCPDGISKQLCDAGTFSGTRGAKTSCTSCAPGKFQSGRGQTKCDACPDGEYSSGTKNTQCSSCQAGRFGSGATLRTSATCTGPCAAGYFCPSGSSSAQQVKCGNARLYCPSSSSSPRAVKAGYYTTGGDETTRSGEKKCESGYKCQGGLRQACEIGHYNTAEGQSSCMACNSLVCSTNKYRNGCGGSSTGTCTTCSVTPSSNDCEAGLTPCPGNTLIDTSRCNECDCPNDGKLYWKRLKDGGGCPDCVECSATPDNCKDPDAASPTNLPSNNEYIHKKCRQDASTREDSTCLKCDAFCKVDQIFNKDCSSNTGPSCSNCRTSCGECEGKPQENCAEPLCTWDDSGTCIPHPLSGQYINPSTKCTGSTFDDTTVCEECSGVVVPNGKYMVQCQEEDNAARFKSLTQCVDGSTYESIAPTRISDRTCTPCNLCPTGEFEAEICTKDKKATCVPVSLPKEGEFVYEIATEKKDTIILPLSDCTLANMWQDTTTPAIPGSAYVAGQDNTCFPYTPCDLKLQYVQTQASETNNWECAELTDCDVLRRNVSKPVFTPVPKSTNYDRICMTCDAWTESTIAQMRVNATTIFNVSEFPSIVHYNESIANNEYKLACDPNTDNKMSVSTIAAIAAGGAFVLFAFAAITRQQRKRRVIQKEKEMADAELDRTKDELELGENMMCNPMQHVRKADNSLLIAKGHESDAEILRLRDEVRRLKMMVQRKDQNNFPSSGMSTRITGRKKEFGQTR